MEPKPLKLSYGAGDGNRTRVISLEGWGSTIELRPQDMVGTTGFEPAVCAPLRSVQDRGPPDLVNPLRPQVLGPQEVAKSCPFEKHSSDSFYLSSMRQDLNLRPLRP